MSPCNLINTSISNVSDKFFGIKKLDSRMWRWYPLTVVSREIPLRFVEKEPGTQISWLHDSSSGQRGYPAELSLAYPVAYSHSQLLHQLSQSPVLGSSSPVSLAYLLHISSGFLALAALHSTVLDLRLNQEPIPISPIPTLTWTWLILSLPTFVRACGQDKSQGWVMV